MLLLCELVVCSFSSVVCGGYCTLCVECCHWTDTEWSKRDQARMKQLFRGTAVERPSNCLPCDGRDHCPGEGRGGHSGEIVGSVCAYAGWDLSEALIDN